jgi:hypothetical protein
MLTVYDFQLCAKRVNLPRFAEAVHYCKHAAAAQVEPVL